MDKTIEPPIDLDILPEQEKDTAASSPVPIEKKVAIEAHGKPGSWMLRLQRTAVLGWVFFFITFVVLIASYFVGVVMPKPLLVVDSDGRLIGEIDFLEPVQRLDEEVISGGGRFLGFFLSLNSHTIFDDYAVATSMMGKELLKKVKKMILEDGYLQKIASANTRSDIEFDKENPPEIIQRGDNESSVRYRGILTMYHKNDPPQKDPFNITLYIKFHPTTSLRESGIEITDVYDN